MKKKIGFVPMDPVLGAWLLEMLAKEPPESDNAGELCAGVQDLLRGEVTSLPCWPARPCRAGRHISENCWRNTAKRMKFPLTMPGR